MVNLTRAKQTLRKHSAQVHHKSAVKDMAVFLGQMESGHLSVDQRLQSHAANTIQKNRQILRSIIKCIIFCGRQNIPLRGHRSESSPYSGENNFATSGNPGNFQCLLQFRMDAGDVLLQDHFSNPDKNAQYRSPTIQNDLIAACKQWIQGRIINEVKSSKYFAVCADEAADISNKEQLPLVLRFVDSSGSIREEFIEFIHCDSGTSGAAIPEKILSGLEQLGLDPKDLRGQGYDGVGNMAGRIQGAAARITEQYPSAYYVHCGSHALNLCVVSACTVQSVRNMHGTLEEIYIFYQYSPKRQQLLEEKIRELENVNHTKLVSLCKTRWVARIEAYEAFQELLTAVVDTLQDIATEDGWNSESSRKANSLLSAVRQFGFIHTFTVVRHGLGFIKASPPLFGAVPMI